MPRSSHSSFVGFLGGPASVSDGQWHYKALDPSPSLSVRHFFFFALNAVRFSYRVSFLVDGFSLVDIHPRLFPFTERNPPGK